MLLSLTLLGPVDFQTTADDGSSLSGQLVELAATSVTLETADGKKVPLAAGAVSELRPATAPKSSHEIPGVWVDLVDGSTLLGSQYTVADQKAMLKTLHGPEITFPTKAIRSVRFKEQNETITAQWQDILKVEADGDLLVIRKDKSIDYLPGIVEKVAPDTVSFELEGEKRAVKRDRVEGIVYAKPRGDDLSAPFCQVRDASGSRIELVKASIADDMLHVATPSGVELDLPLAEVATIAFKVDYLSDLEPEKMVFTPYVGTPESLSHAAQTFSKPRLNRGFDRPELRLAGETYHKGIAARSRSELVFRLPKGFRTLDGLAGIDDDVRPLGKVKLQFLGDGKVLAEHEITGADAPLPVRVDLEGVDRLSIVVDFDGDEVGDRLYLCGLRLVK